jgi:putative ABC transport system substrate-binding protein
LRELGSVEGQNIVVEYRYADSKFDRLPGLAAELVRLKVEVIVATPTPAAVAASKATTTVPIVMTSVGDPVGLGLVSTLAHPGGNVTGLSYSVGNEIIGKGLELLKEAIPEVQRVAVLSNPANPSRDPALPVVMSASRSLGLQLQLLEARGSGGFDSAFEAMARERAEALFVLADSMFFVHRTRLADLAVRSRLSSMYGNREAVEAGGLMSYGPDFTSQFRRAAVYVDKTRKGTTSKWRGPSECT